jgi:hypothetical protein
MFTETVRRLRRPGIEFGGLAIDCRSKGGKSCCFEMESELREEVRIGQRLS